VKRRPVGAAAVPVLAAALVVCTGSALARAGSRLQAGDPARGAAVWVSAGCGACHAFARAGSTGLPSSTAPDLDRWLEPDAARLHLPVEVFAYRRIFYGGRGMGAFGTTLGSEELDDLVAFVVGRPFTAPAGAVSPVPPLPAPPPLVKAPARAVARWSTTARLPKRAAQGAALFATIGCLSCHTYLGNGVRRRGAPDLSREGVKRRSASWLRRYVARAYTFGNARMPAYADLTATRLSRLAAFLAASRGPHRG
jgi:mono/diheme cytochrome c family protein